MSSIVTFYSYKGGVGRSMALANIAFDLSKKGKKILIVDWDLEAPGLEKYFVNYSIDNSGNGLLPMLMDVGEGTIPDYKKYLWTIQLDPNSKISFLHSGREKDPANYSANLEQFAWDEFFINKAGGVFLENLRNQWKTDFDIVLIDSRTGLSDTSGICSILLPDIIVPMFTANHQSLYGVRDTVRFIQSARQKLSTDRMTLTIFPVPTRFGSRVEFKESQEWLDRFAEALKEFYADWLPKWIEPRYVLEQVKIPQVDYFSFGEKLAVAEHGISDPEGMGFIYSRIGSLLASDFEDISSFIGSEYYHTKKMEYEMLKEKDSQKNNTGSYDFDIFISHAHDSFTNQWISEFLPVLTEYLIDELGYTPRIYSDIKEIFSGEIFSDSVETALQKSKLLIAVLSPEYLKSDYTRFELSNFLLKENYTENKIVFPLALKKSEMDGTELSLLGDRQVYYFDNMNLEELKRSNKSRFRFIQEVNTLATLIADSLKNFTIVSNAGINTNNLTPEKQLQIDNEIKMLANEYEEIRRIMPAGSKRTKQMDFITSKMKALTPKIFPVIDNLIKSESPGERLAAIAALQEKPDHQYIDWLAKHVGDAEKPFIGYQATVGLYIATRALGKEYKKEIQMALDTAYQNIENSEKKDPNQIDVLDSAKLEIGYQL